MGAAGAVCPGRHACDGARSLPEPERGAKRGPQATGNSGWGSAMREAYDARMTADNRRRVERHASDLPGRLRLSGGREIDVRIRNIACLGALCEIHDLEEPVLEGERGTLEHPELADGRPPVGPFGTANQVATEGRIVRVELEFRPDGVVRHVAVHFDAVAGRDTAADE